MTKDEERERRNPVLGLPSAKIILTLSPKTRLALAAVLTDLKKDAAARASKSWLTHKAPMAVYWKAVSVYAGHLARVVKDGL